MGNDILSVMEVRKNFEALPSKQASSKRKLSDISLPSNPSRSKKGTDKSDGHSSNPSTSHIPLPDGYPAPYNPENPGMYSNDNQAYYNWDQQFQQYQNYPHQ